MDPGIAAAVVCAVVGGVFVVEYNSIVKLRNRVFNAWGDVAAVLKQRHDLIPNLVETVKGYAQHERELLERITQERARAAQGDVDAEVNLTRLLGQLRVTVENYPDLKASEEFRKLMEQLEDIENTLREMRRYYNAAVRDYNAAVESFPGIIIARLGKLPRYRFFEVPEEETAAPVVKFTSDEQKQDERKQQEVE